MQRKILTNMLVDSNVLKELRRIMNMVANEGWIGVDLDGTLAEYHGWVEGIGQPIPLMVERVKAWIALGIKVKIFTARAENMQQIAAVQKWLLQQGIPALEVTNKKDSNMIELWDDRCIQVKMNAGVAIGQSLFDPLAKPESSRHSAMARKTICDIVKGNVK